MLRKLLVVLAIASAGYAYYGTQRLSEVLIAREAQSKVVKIGVSQDKQWYVGSGALISADGNILTCGHLFFHHGSIVVKTASGQTYQAHIVRVDHKVDLAVIKIDAPRPLPYFHLGHQPRIGQKVLAFGSPLNIQGTVSVGYVENIGPFTIHGAAINPGNSGGPLVDEDGLLVGVNVAILLLNPIQTAAGMGIAVSLGDIYNFIRL